MRPAVSRSAFRRFSAVVLPPTPASQLFAAPPRRAFRRRAFSPAARYGSVSQIRFRHARLPPVTAAIVSQVDGPMVYAVVAITAAVTDSLQPELPLH